MKTKNNWGPRFTINESIKKMKPKEYMALQWLACVNKAEVDFKNSGVDVINIKFEDILENPTMIQNKLEVFLGVPSIKFNINKNVAHSVKNIKIEDYMSDTFIQKLKALGYE